MLPDREGYIMIRGTNAEQSAQGSTGGSLLTADGRTVALPAGIRTIDVDLPQRRSDPRPSGAPGAECVAFGGYRVEGNRFVLSKPEDPMAELVLLHGDPEFISARSGRMASSYAIVSALFIIFNAAINVPLMFILLSLLIR
jgi:hypothetical protein